MAPLLNVLGYLLRAILVIAGSVLTLGVVWFIGELQQTPSLVLELGAGLAAITIGCLPINFGGTRLWPWLVCILLILANAIVVTVGIVKGGYDMEVLLWPLLSLIPAAMLLPLAASKARQNPTNTTTTQ